MTVRALWNGTVLAEEAHSDDVSVVEGNVYFPPESVNTEYLQNSASHTRCYWKGKASYYDVVVEGQDSADAAWYYPKPSRLAKQLKDKVAFWRGVKIEHN